MEPDNADTPRAVRRPQDDHGVCSDGLQGLHSVLLVLDGRWTRYTLTYFVQAPYLRGQYAPMYCTAAGQLRRYGGPLSQADIEELYGSVEVRGRSLYPISGGNSAANQPRLQPNIVVSAAGAGPSSCDGLTGEELQWLEEHVRRQRSIGGATVKDADEAMRRASGGRAYRIVNGKRVTTARLVGRVLDRLGARPRRRPLLLVPADKTRAFR